MESSLERIPKPCSAWKKAGLVEISLTPENINNIVGQTLRNGVELTLKHRWGSRDDSSWEHLPC